MKFTQEQINGWKNKHGRIFEVSVAGHSCILHKPTRKNISYLSTIKDPIKMGEMMLKELWVAGDECLREDDELFMAVVSKLDGLIQVKEAELKEL